ncbi:hypothetical protein PJN28_29425, partial [Mycobacterium kansasii]
TDGKQVDRDLPTSVAYGKLVEESLISFPDEKGKDVPLQFQQASPLKVSKDSVKLKQQQASTTASEFMSLVQRFPADLPPGGSLASLEKT